MTQVLITIDTELSFAFEAAGRSIDDNFASSILGRCAAGEFGVGWQMDRLEAHGLRGVFFVDPLPALGHGVAPIRAIVEPIRARGHEVQLHIHTEWLAAGRHDPVAGARGQNIADFWPEDQRTLLALARDLLVEAGAPSPIAFRAGNYGANDDTLAALAGLGIRYDSSFNPTYLGAPCDIGLPPGQVAPVRRGGVIEVPVAAIEATPGRLRHAQICALSASEMEAGLRHAAQGDAPFVIVSHSFEMLSRDRLRPNRMVMARFEAMCRAIAGNGRLESAGFGDLELHIDTAHPELVEGCFPTEPSTLRQAQGERADRLPPSYPRTFARIAEQAIGRILYERG